MSFIFAGGELADFDTSLTTSTNYSTSTINFDGNYSRVSMSVINAAQIGKRIEPQNEVWFKATLKTGNAGTSAVRYFMAAEPESQPFVRIGGTGEDGVLSILIWDGVDYVPVVTSSGPVFGTSVTNFCLRIKVGSGGFVRFYVDGLEVLTHEADFSGIDPISKIILSAGMSSFSRHWSEVIVASHDVRTARLKVLPITGVGAANEWTGSYTDIDDHNETDDAFISSDTAEQKVLFTKGGLVDDSLNVDAVILSGRFRQNTSGPSNIDALVRVDGTDYGKTVGDIVDAFSLHQAIFAVNPATSAPWTREAVEAAQIGLQSKA